MFEAICFTKYDKIETQLQWKENISKENNYGVHKEQ